MMEHLREAIRTMRANTSPTKSGVIRSLLSEIEEARVAGYRLKAIWQCVHDRGLDVTYAEFCVYLRRAKAKPSRRVPADKTDSRASPPTNQIRGVDPLANIRRREAARPGFHYQGTQDLDDLVHGKKRK